MKKLGFFLISAALMVGSTAALSAADYTIFIHGRSGSNHCGTGTSDVNNYWGNAKNINTSTTKYFIGYDGSSDPRTFGSCRAQSNINSVLSARCTGSNNCKVICHSAGCYAIEYFLDKTTSNFNVDLVIASSSAAGGSELADLAFWASGGMDAALKVNAARGSYNHNDMKGTGIWAIAGYKGVWYASWRLPGDDDGAVALHSTCGHSSSGSHNSCNQSRYSSHYLWSGSYNNNNSYSSSKKAYNRTHVGDGSSSINDAMKKEWNDCKATTINGFNCD
ncbi:MAG: hypothetical protein RIF32_21760 [Leptospirales bacterium]|jgi:hypothetical protein